MNNKIEILKQKINEADALDRWRLGNHGLDPKYLRTEQAADMVEYSRRIVSETEKL